MALVESPLRRAMLQIAGIPEKDGTYVGVLGPGEETINLFTRPEPFAQQQILIRFAGRITSLKLPESLKQGLPYFISDYESAELTKLWAGLGCQIKPGPEGSGLLILQSIPPPEDLPPAIIQFSQDYLGTHFLPDDTLRDYILNGVVLEMLACLTLASKLTRMPVEQIVQAGLVILEEGLYSTKFSSAILPGAMIPDADPHIAYCFPSFYEPERNIALLKGLSEKIDFRPFIFKNSNLF